MLVEEALHRARIVGVQVQAGGGVLVGRALEHRADQARLEGREEAHRLDRGLAQLAQPARLGIGLEQALVFAQRGLDLAVARQRALVADAQAFGRLVLGEVEVAHALLGHDAGRLGGDPLALFAIAVLRVAAGVGGVHGRA